ncbi:MAG TPA: flavodoxin domain-containing protein [Chloroflexota bacterium]|nr:flavodoxin domain-containing protein [Chloroflexota bacterium]
MATTGLTRRRFLAVAGIALGGGVLTYSDLQLPEVGGSSGTLPEITLGENAMSDKILVAYASRTGSTAGVAEAIGRVLAESGPQVDVRPMKEVKDVTHYRAVVAGSAIRGCKWLPEAMEFVQLHQSMLASKPFAAFLVCITLATQNEEWHKGVATWMEPVRAMVKPVSEGLFAGTLNLDKLPLLPDGLTMRVPVALGIFPQGDHRDWGAIRAWATELRPKLAA